MKAEPQPSPSSFDTPVKSAPSASPTPAPSPGASKAPLSPTGTAAPGPLVIPPEDNTSGGAPKLTDMPIWWGDIPFSQVPAKGVMKGVQAGGMGFGQTPGSTALSWLTTIFLTDKKQWDSLVGLMLSNGYIDPKDAADPSKVAAAWTQAVQGSATAQAAGQNVTPFEYIKVWGLRSGFAGNKKSGGPQHNHQSVTNTSTNVDDASSIAKTAQQVAVDKLGTGLSASKVNAVVSLVQDLERAHPSVTTTTEDQTMTGAGTANTSTKSSVNSDTQGAYDPTLDIQGFVQGQPDFAENQASTYYFNAAMQALGALNGAGA